MNPLREDWFWKCWNDVGGLDSWKFVKMVSSSATDLPNYLPAVKNGSRRVLRLQLDWVAIPLFKIIRRIPGGGYGCRFETGDDLRTHFMIGEDTKIMAIGVDHDNRLEGFWEKHRSSGVIDKLAQMGLDAVSAPNFSLFSDSNRFQHLRNLKRMLLVCERLSSAGIPVIPHLNAHNQSDWDFWGEFLREHSEITTVCKEFQTGPKNLFRGNTAIENLSKLREAAGRDIHCILVGGGSFYTLAQKLLGNSFTVTDSRPFMLALSRRLLQRTESGGVSEISCQTLPGQGVDHIFLQDIAVHADRMQNSSSLKRLEKKVACQGEFDLPISTPNLISQPAA